MQLSDIVRMLPPSIPGLRVEVVIALFSKVIDLPEFHRALFALSYPERMAVRERLGWLNMCVTKELTCLCLFRACWQPQFATLACRNYL